KFAAKLPHQVFHDKLISRKIKLAPSAYAIWVNGGFIKLGDVDLWDFQLQRLSYRIHFKVFSIRFKKQKKIAIKRRPKLLPSIFGQDKVKKGVLSVT
ncbi:hypothetical protein AVEN_33785-1, partial [Araneus ventricosus]